MHRIAGIAPALPLLAAAGAALVWLAAAAPAAAVGYHSIGRDDFPVFDQPRMLTAAEADAREAVLPGDAVIGVVHGEEAKAYPITIMGVHELGNDTIGGIPIAVSW